MLARPSAKIYPNAKLRTSKDLIQLQDNDNELEMPRIPYNCIDYGFAAIFVQGMDEIQEFAREKQPGRGAIGRFPNGKSGSLASYSNYGAS